MNHEPPSKRPLPAQAECIILGAGASGLMCAWQAAMRGRQVVLLDHGGRPGRKVRISGGGHCNVTNRHVGAANYVSQNPHFCISALARFPPQQILDLLSEHSIAVEERDHGRIFCRNGAGEVAGLLVRLAKRYGAEIFPDCEVSGLRLAEGDFLIETNTGVCKAKRVVIALGGPAWPQAGATGTAYALAKSLGLNVVTPRPALAPLRMRGGWALAGMAGIAIQVRIGCEGAAFTDQLLFTHQVISGPAALQASLVWKPGTSLRVDFLPAMSMLDVLHAAKGTARLRNLLSRRIPERLAQAILGDMAMRDVAGLSNSVRQLAAQLVHEHTIEPIGVESWTKAEVAAGGVDTANFSSKTMECTSIPGLYCLGEALDVTGQLGGYNLHWAWASGWAAGQHI